METNLIRKLLVYVIIVTMTNVKTQSNQKVFALNKLIYVLCL